MNSKIKFFNKIVEKKYKIICKINDPLYFAFDWLFPAGSNFEKVINYETNFKRKYFFYTIYLKQLILLLYILKNFLKFGVLSLRKINNKHKFDNKNIFFSHLNNVEHINNKNDFYFGSIPNWLKEKYLIIFNNNTKKPSYEIQKILKKKQFLVPEFLGFKEEYKILITYSKLVNYFRSINIPDKNFEQELHYQLYNRGIIYNLRKLFFFKKILNSNINKVFLTYEGHYSEAFIIKYSNKLKIKTFAYNHSYFYDFQKKYRNLHYRNFTPDVVFLTGPYIKQKIKFLPNQKIFIIGSNKVVLNKSNNVNFHKKPNNCLVLGDDVELTKKLFSLIFDLAKKNKKIKFYLKLHPSIKINQIIENTNIFNKNNNIIITNQKIEKLYDNVKWVVYQRTTGVLNSINFNVKPIYFDNSQINLDPLINVKHWKQVFKSKNELEKILINDIKRSKLKKSNNIFKVKKMIKNYFFPMEKNQVLKIKKI